MFVCSGQLSIFELNTELVRMNEIRLMLKETFLKIKIKQTNAPFILLHIFHHRIMVRCHFQSFYIIFLSHLHIHNY